MPLNPASRRTLALLLPLACLTARLAHAQAPAAPLDASTVAVRGARAEAFVPAGGKIAAQVAGDLNGDGRADRVLHLVPRDTGYADPLFGPESQALVILLAAP